MRRIGDKVRKFSLSQYSGSKVITSTEKYLSLRLELRELLKMLLTYVMILKFLEVFNCAPGRV